MIFLCLGFQEKKLGMFLRCFIQSIILIVLVLLRMVLNLNDLNVVLDVYDLVAHLKLPSFSVLLRVEANVCFEAWKVLLFLRGLRGTLTSDDLFLVVLWVKVNDHLLLVVALNGLWLAGLFNLRDWLVISLLIWRVLLHLFLFGARVFSSLILFIRVLFNFLFKLSVWVFHNGSFISFFVVYSLIENEISWFVHF